MLKRKLDMMNYANLEEESKIFFQPGDTVTLKQDIPNKPTMIVYRVERSIIKNKDDYSPLRGVRCRWFAEGSLLLEAVFSTKDLILV